MKKERLKTKILAESAYVYVLLPPSYLFRAMTKIFYLLGLEELKQKYCKVVCNLYAFNAIFT